MAEVHSFTDISDSRMRDVSILKRKSPDTALLLGRYLKTAELLEGYMRRIYQ